MGLIFYFVLGFLLVLLLLAIWYFLIYLRLPTIQIPDNSTSEKAISLIDTWLKKLNQLGKFNGGVLITKQHVPYLMKTYGFIDHERKIKLTNQSSFRLASVSKQFTAAGIMLLKEKRLLDYDDLVSKYLTSFPYTGVTIRHLLGHTSGIPDQYLKLAEKHLSKDKDLLSNQKAVELLFKYAPKCTHLPNENFNYSNTNYILLARIIEVISKQSFEAYMKTEIFKPLNMKNSRVWNLLSTEKTFPNKTSGFYKLGSNYYPMEPDYLDGVGGDGAVFSSLEDLLIWDKFWYKNHLIRPKNLEEAFKPQKLNNGETSGYGFGWILEDDFTVHSGGWLAARVFIGRNTKSKTCLVIIDNSLNQRVSKIIITINKILDQKF